MLHDNDDAPHLFAGPLTIRPHRLDWNTDICVRCGMTLAEITDGDDSVNECRTFDSSAWTGRKRRDNAVRRSARYCRNSLMWVYFKSDIRHGYIRRAFRWLFKMQLRDNPKIGGSYGGATRNAVPLSSGRPGEVPTDDLRR